MTIDEICVELGGKLLPDGIVERTHRTRCAIVFHCAVLGWQYRAIEENTLHLGELTTIETVGALKRWILNAP